MSDKNLPRSGDANGAFAISGAVWDKLCAMVEGGQIEVGPGLSLTSVPGGSLLRLVVTDLVRPLKITGTETGSGFYKGRTLIGTPTNIVVTNTVSLPLTGTTLANADDALILFFLESGIVGHQLPIPSFGAGLLLGVTNDSPPRKVFLWLSGAPAVGFASVVTNSATVAGDYGSATASNRATLKYDITPYGGSGTIAANVAPYSSPGRAFKQKVTAGTVGIYFVSAGSVILYDVNEFADDQLNCT